MYRREKRVLLRHYLEQGFTKTALAEKLGISRRTVYHWIETGQLERELDEEVVRYRSRPPIKRKLDPYRGIVQARLEGFPELSAVRLYEELRAAGYEGGYTQLKEYVREVRPRVSVEPLIRFETLPGQQAQADFAHFRLPWGRRWALLVVLGYSRLLWLRFFARQSMETVFRGLEEAFAAFGGVPQEVLFDQMRTVVLEDRRGEGGSVVENPEFLRFAHHWGFRARVCRPYRAKTKGKVERPIRYVRENFFYGREFLNDADLNDQAERWLLRVANVRRHRTIDERPQDRFERDEKAALKPLALRPYGSLVIPMDSQSPTSRSTPSALSPIQVDRRALQVYARLAEGEG